MMATTRFLLATFLVCATGCSRTPCPLTPSFQGAVGLPYNGVLTNPVPLPPNGRGFRRFKPPGAHYGTQALVSTIAFAAEQVDIEMPGSILNVGDLSGPSGGQILNHQSHRNGLDVDLLFYTTDLRGAPIESTGWTRIDRDGIGKARAPHGGIHVEVDIPRNWLLVKALMESPHAQIQWLFVSRPVESLLIEYALARGEDPVLVWQAENVMHQPRNSLPHDDHFHVRIVCPPQNTVCGCESGGPQWPWLHPLPKIDWPKDTPQIQAFLETDVGEIQQ